MGLLDGILGFLGGAGDVIGSILSFVLQVIVDVANFIWVAVQVIFSFVVTVFKGIWTFFAHIWDNFFKKIFVSTFRALRTLSTWLESHLRPIIDWLKRAQHYILDIYTKYVKPILVMIQRVRQVLTVLRALHIKWAEQLDAILGKVQSDINAVFLKITGTINSIIDVLNIVTDPERLLRHPVLILSVQRSFLAMVRQLTGLPPGFFFPSHRASAPTGTGSTPLNFIASNPSINPPASYYMSLPSAVPSLGNWQSGLEVPNDFTDGVAPLDYFNNDLADSPDCSDWITCYLAAVQANIARNSNV